MYAHLAELASLLFNLFVLSIVMSVVGWGVIRMLRIVTLSRANERMQREAMVAAALHRARLRREARSAQAFSFDT